MKNLAATTSQLSNQTAIIVGAIFIALVFFIIRSKHKLLWIVGIAAAVFIDGKYFHILNHMGIINGGPGSCKVAPKC